MLHLFNSFEKAKQQFHNSRDTWHVLNDFTFGAFGFDQLWTLYTVLDLDFLMFWLRASFIDFGCRFAHLLQTNKYRSCIYYHLVKTFVNGMLVLNGIITPVENFYNNYSLKIRRCRGWILLFQDFEIILD